MDYKYYQITRQSYDGKVDKINYDEMGGFCFKPKNNIKNDGILVDRMLLVKPSLIDNVLKRKIKRKIEKFLKIVIENIENDDEDPSNLRHALNDLTRYKSIITNKYRKYIEQEYYNEAKKKIQLLEKELEAKLEYTNNLQLENINKKSR